MKYLYIELRQAHPETRAEVDSVVTQGSREPTLDDRVRIGQGRLLVFRVTAAGYEELMPPGVEPPWVQVSNEG